MGCNCGKPKCDGKCGISPAVLEINNNGCTMFHKVVVPASMGTSTENPPKVGAYKNVILYYEADSEAYIYSSDGIPTKITGVSTDYNILQNKPSINNVVLIGNKTLAELGITGAINDAVAAEAAIREGADNDLQHQIDVIVAASDVVDIVGTYAELQAYDTSKLHDNDIVKVLEDETKDDATTYYRWHKGTSSWEYIGAQGPYYTKDQTDTLLNGKQDKLTAGANIQINGSVISATDTTYTAGSGIDITGTVISGMTASVSGTTLILNNA